ncbi:hypothetical protein [Acinetobacter sp. NigerLNRRAM0016]
MNLIEQLGGYEKSKRELKLKEESSILQCCSSITADMIRDALLDYRRQHNIFEVGDKVKANDGQFGFNELFKIDDFFADDDGINLAVLDDGDCYPLSCLTHATDAEIKAGKRLEMT